MTKYLSLLGLSAAGAFLLTACATPTDPEDANAYRDQQVARAESEGMVCSYEQVMGSLRRERVCRSAEEIERARQEGRDSVERYQRSAPSSVNEGG